MNDVLDFLNRYFDAEYATHKLDLTAKNEEPVHEAFEEMTKEFFAKAGIQTLTEYLHGSGTPTADDVKAMKSELQRRPLFRIERYGKGKSELFCAYSGYYKKTKEQAYRYIYFVRRQPKLQIVARYAAAPGFYSSGVLKWESGRGEKIVVEKLGTPVEVLKVQAPTHKASLALYNDED